MLSIHSTRQILKNNCFISQSSKEYFKHIGEVVDFHNNKNLSKSQRECQFLIYLDKLQEYAHETYYNHFHVWRDIAEEVEFPFDKDTNFDVSDLNSVIDEYDNTKPALSLRIKLRGCKHELNVWTEPFEIKRDDIESILWIDNATAFAKEFNDDELLTDILKINKSHIESVFIA